MNAPPLSLGAGQQTMTPSNGDGGRTRRWLEMLESVLALGGLVLLRGEGHRPGGFGAGLKGRKRRGRTKGHSLEAQLRRVRVETSVLMLFIRLSLFPRLCGVGGPQSFEGANQEICAVVSSPQHLPVLRVTETGPHPDILPRMCLSGEQVHILGCEVSEEEFREGFDSNINSQ